MDSALGRFSWATIDEDKYVPTIFRNGEQYCCVRMVEVSIIRELLNSLPPDVYDSANLSCHAVCSSFEF